MPLLSIVLAIAFLGLLSLIGALLVVWSTRVVFREASAPVPIRRGRGAVTIWALLQLWAFVVGLALLGLGLRGIYRVFWATY
ncbi:MAG: hypothetical protein HY683_00585 [Chloroflexi bacterium]|nr:hypothetical protein [Chloroflexota bacterium]